MRETCLVQRRIAIVAKSDAICHLTFNLTFESRPLLTPAA
jgi:hypothetical protein